MTDPILFISHKQSDSPDEFEKLYNHLRTHYDDDEIYIDIDSNEPGKPWMDSQQAALDACACMLVVVGKDWTPGQWISHELATAYERKIPVIPVGIGGHPNFMDADTLGKWIEEGLGKLIPPYTHELAIVDDIKHLFDKQAEIITNVNDITQLEELDRLIWSRALMPPCKGKLPAGFHLPFNRNEVFTGREQDLLTLAKLAMEKNPNTMLVTQLVEGMGGIGKTQLAVEFCYRYGRFFKGVHWLNLGDPSAFEEQVAENGRKMFGAKADSMELPDLVRQTLAAWESEGPRLVILDNLEDEDSYAEIAERLNNCDVRIILTARNSAWEDTLIPEEHRLPVGLFTPQESLEYLKKILKEKYDDAQLEKLADYLYHLPLALMLASAYLKKPHVGIHNVDDYLAKLEELSIKHGSFQRGGKEKGGTKHELNLEKTFLLSYEALPDENSRFIFRALSFIAPNQLFPVMALNHLYENDEVYDRSINEIENSSLVRIYEGGLLLIHPLIAEFGQLLEGSNDVLKRLSVHFEKLSRKSGKTGFLEKDERMYPHFFAVTRNSMEANIDEGGSLANNIGVYFQSIADFYHAKESFNFALIVARRKYGEYSTQTAAVLVNQGKMLTVTGDFSEAEACFSQALRIYGETDGNNASVATVLSNFGFLMCEKGEYETAEDMYFRALEIDESEKENNHHVIIRDYLNLTAVQNDQGKYEDAKSFVEKALQMYLEENLDDDNLLQHVYSLLGKTLFNIEQYEEAKVYFEKSLQICEDLFDTNHTSIASECNNIGITLYSLHCYESAKKFCKKALQITESLYGEASHKNAKTLNNLGLIHLALKEYELSEYYFEQSLKIETRVYGEGHPNIARDLNNFGGLFFEQGEYLKAILFFKQAIKVWLLSFSKDHPYIVKAQESIRLCVDIMKNQEKEKLRQIGLQLLGLLDGKLDTIE